MSDGPGRKIGKAHTGLRYHCKKSQRLLGFIVPDSCSKIQSPNKENDDAKEKGNGSLRPFEHEVGSSWYHPSKQAEHGQIPQIRRYLRRFGFLCCFRHDE